MTERNEYRQMYEVEKRWNKIIQKQNNILISGSLVIMWILIFAQPNILIALLPIIPIGYIMIKDMFFSREKK